MISSGDSRILPVSDYDLESRFSKLEHEVNRLREDVASARALAALADRDVAELRTEMRAHHKVLNALRETQLEECQRIDELRQEIDELRQELCRQIDELRQEIGGLGQELRQEIGGLGQELREGFAMQSTGMAQITALLTTIAGPEHAGS
jgi:chromosome segregation ATPase